MIAEQLESPRDLQNMRLVCKQFARATTSLFLDKLASDRVIYVSSESVATFVKFIVRFPYIINRIKHFTIVSEVLKHCEQGYDWAWNVVAGHYSVIITDGDMVIIDRLHALHEEAITYSNAFIMTGRFRLMLGAIFAHCTKLGAVTLRHLKVDTPIHVGFPARANRFIGR